jgi:S1-C subfamily serine protease
VVIDPSGLTAIALSSVDPTSLFQTKMETEVSDLKMLLNDGTESPAEIVLRDRDLDLAFVRPKIKPSSPLSALDLSKSAKVDVMDEVISINRLGRVAGRTHSASVERISAVVQKPRLFYIPGTDKTSTGLGCPAFAFDGRLVGLFVMRSLRSGSEASSFSFQSSIAAIILPAEDIKKIAAQVPALSEDSK